LPILYVSATIKTGNKSETSTSKSEIIPSIFTPEKKPNVEVPMSMSIQDFISMIKEEKKSGAALQKAEETNLCIQQPSKKPLTSNNFEEPDPMSMSVQDLISIINVRNKSEAEKHYSVNNALQKAEETNLCIQQPSKKPLTSTNFEDPMSMSILDPISNLEEENISGAVKHYSVNDALQKVEEADFCLQQPSKKPLTSTNFEDPMSMSILDPISNLEEENISGAVKYFSFNNALQKAEEAGFCLQQPSASASPYIVLAEYNLPLLQPTEKKPEDPDPCLPRPLPILYVSATIKTGNKSETSTSKSEIIPSIFTPEKKPNVEVPMSMSIQDFISMIKEEKKSGAALQKAEETNLCIQQPSKKLVLNNSKLTTTILVIYLKIAHNISFLTFFIFLFA
jgi:hypothetical protein